MSRPGHNRAASLLPILTMTLVGHTAAAAPGEGVTDGEGVPVVEGVGVPLGGTAGQGGRPPPNSCFPAYREAP